MNGYSKYYHQGIEVFRADFDGKGGRTDTHIATAEEWTIARKLSALLNAAIAWDINAIEAGRVTFQEKKEAEA